MIRILSLAVLSFTILSLWPTEAAAVSQFSRKYNVPCATCHTVFPRLNYYGEKFLRNGYQVPGDTSDGDDVGKKRLGSDLTLGTVEDWLGVRLNVTPFAAKTNALTVNGEKETQYTIGNPDWMQFFVAGSIFKDVSIFIENEFASSSFKFNWYYLGFHNLAGKAANLQFGNVSPLLFASFPNRLPIHPNLKNDAYRIKGSATAAAGLSTDALDTSSARPGMQYYGEGGPLVWWAGVSPGSKGKDVNEFLNYWAGLRFEVVEDWDSPLKGSNVSLHYQTGTDATATNPQIENDYTRTTLSFNLRAGNLDMQAGYIRGEDDNITLTAVPVESRFSGWTAVAAYKGGSKWVPGVQWDVTNINEPAQVAGKYVEMNRLTPTLTYMMRQDLRITAYAGIDLLDEDPATPHPKKQNEFTVNIRTMF